ncbi:hypothetical protein RHGRI_015970 [Rhododendron griersonianum]|uniref:RNase H type-1 domain-containing protein n=1 Tax=Rhododendron griersonianum TaxID=479676 RepID=A0AAV6JS31_9ERIC|nr:hypothetical protein RHGRI_015970 [Rhododendron griersonianum]
MAVKLINEGTPPDHPDRIIIEDAKMLLNVTNTTFGHTNRQVNQTADNLALLGAEQDEDLGSV